MGKLSPVIPALLAWLPLAISAHPQEAPPKANAGATATNRIIGYTAWDDDFFYIGIQVNKPTLSGKNSAAFSNPLEDDAIIVSIQTDNDHTTMKRTAATYTFVASSMGGTQLYSGEKAVPLFKGLADFSKQYDAILKDNKDPKAQQDKMVALTGKLIKKEVLPKGAPRPIGTPAPGYTVEAAIPWAVLGGRPAVNARMGFHVAAQSIVSGSPPLQSLSAKVKGASDFDNPSLWNQITFSNQPAPATSETLHCPRVFGNKPLMDGELSTAEWNNLSSFEFGERLGPATGAAALPATREARVPGNFTPRAPRPVVSVVPNQSAKAGDWPRKAQAVTPLVFAQYAYWYQADTRKQAPAGRVLQPDGTTALARHPLSGTGPWFSYDRADWHYKQLTEARSSGIDVLLPIYRGSPRDRQLYADKGLLVLATALQQLRQGGRDYPLIALALDTNSLIDTFGDRPDLREPTVQNALYGMIHDFYVQIPAAFRCQVPLSAANGGRIAYPVFLSEAGAFKGMDAGFIATVRRRFAADFHGVDLVFIGDPAFKASVPLDGYIADVREKGAQFNGDGWIKLASVAAGYDSVFTASATESQAYRSRRGGDTYRNDWTSALAKRPDWVVLDGWNDYSNGGSIAPTLEGGYVTSDATRLFTRQFAGNAKAGVKFVWNDAPPALLSGTTTLLNVRARNNSLFAWPAVPTPGLEPVHFAYRWRRGEAVLVSRTVTDVKETVIPGETAGLALPVSATDANGAPLPAGDYTLEFGAISGDKKNTLWIGEDVPGSVMQTGVRIRGKEESATEWNAALIRTNLPRLLESGSVYEVDATLRNDGPAVWRKADGARVTLRLYRSERNATAENATETVVPAADATAELTEDVAPGQEAKVKLSFPVMDADGKPLPVWKQDDDWTYLLRWEVAADRAPQGSGPVPAVLNTEAKTVGIAFATTPVALVEFDFGVRFIADGTPPTLPGEKRQPVAMGLQNVGTQTWKADKVRVGYHWFYLDGSEFIWEDETTPIPQDVAPGGVVKNLLSYVTAPPTDGMYWLAWDVKVGDTWASTSAASRISDTSVRLVRVVGGRLNFADLSKAYNLDGISEDDDRGDGNFDGKGNSFPASLVPPFTDLPIVPAGMWIPSEKAGPDSSRLVGFRWGPKEAKALNFIVCKGQKLELGKSAGPCRLLHILSATTSDKPAFANFNLLFQEPTSISRDLYAFTTGPWEGTTNGKPEAAFISRRYHDVSAVRVGNRTLYHTVIRIKEPRKLIGLILPNSPDIKIAAITLEK